MPGIENRQANLWWGKQTAKGTPVTLPGGAFRQGRWVGGDVTVNRDDASENYIDGTRFNTATDYVNTIQGAGAPVLQGTPGTVGHLAYLMLGQEVVTGGTDEVQTVTITGTPTGGTFTSSIVVNGQTYTTGNIAFNATATAVRDAILALTDIFQAGDITAGGGPLPGTPVTLTFAQKYAKTDVTLMTATGSFTGGATPAVAITQTTAGGPFNHVATPASAGSFWTGWFKKVGQTVGPLRQRFDDCKFTSLRLEASSGSKVLHVTPSFTSISNVGQTFAGGSDPSAGQELYVEPMLYTEGEGTFTIDGTVLQGSSSYALTIADNVTPYYGDSVYPFEVTYGLGEITLENVTILVDANGLSFYNRQIYGTATPAAGTSPSKLVPALGSYSNNLTRGMGTSGARGVKTEVPGVHWSPDLAIPASPDGGAVELSLTGGARQDAAGDPMVRITTRSSDAAYT